MKGCFFSTPYTLDINEAGTTFYDRNDPYSAEYQWYVPRPIIALDNSIDQFEDFNPEIRNQNPTIYLSPEHKAHLPALLEKMQIMLSGYQQNKEALLKEKTKSLAGTEWTLEKLVELKNRNWEWLKRDEIYKLTEICNTQVLLFEKTERDTDRHIRCLQQRIQHVQWLIKSTQDNPADAAFMSSGAFVSTQGKLHRLCISLRTGF